MSIQVDFQLDCKGLSCPMPIVRTKKAINQLEPGQVIEVQAYLGTKQEGNVLKHYLRKANASEIQEERKHPHVIQNEDLLQKLDRDEDFLLLDVREPAEYAFGHIPGACSIPFGQLESRLDEINPNQPIYVVCRTGTRSDLAAQLLAKLGFQKVINVIPGMSEWTGPVDKKVQ